jgi:hypothetical protein
MIVVVMNRRGARPNYCARTVSTNVRITTRIQEQAEVVAGSGNDSIDAVTKDLP